MKLHVIACRQTFSLILIFDSHFFATNQFFYEQKAEKIMCLAS
jgi:hypothetical protein